MSAKFADSKCEHCGASLSRRTPKNVQVITPRAGEPDFGQRLLAPCPGCRRYLPVVGETAEPEQVAETEPTEPVSEPSEPE